MQDKYLLELTLSGHLEQRKDGLWVSFNDEFGFITYGKTPTQAIRETKAALDMVLDTYNGQGVAKLERWLNRKDVKYSLTKIRSRKAVRAAPAKLAQSGTVQKYRVTTRRQLAAAA